MNKRKQAAKESAPPVFRANEISKSYITVNKFRLGVLLNRAINTPMIKILPFLITFLIPAIAYADELLPTAGFLSGIKHPVLGPDHLLAMVCVGIVSAQLGGRAIWAVPLTFVTVMALGAIWTLAYVGVGRIEIGIAASVVVLGFAVVIQSRISFLLIYPSVAFFAVYHGYAHGLEIPQLANFWPYTAGFVLGTAGLHLLGVGIGHFFQKIPYGDIVLRGIGGLVAGIGLYFLTSLLGFNV